MKEMILAALVQLAARYVPKALAWLADNFLKDFGKFLENEPELVAKLDAIGTLATGGTENTGAAPDALKDWLREAMDKFGQSIPSGRPVVRRLYAQLSSFIVNTLADQLWDKLFGAEGVRPNGLTRTARPVFPQEEAGFVSALLTSASESGAAPHVLFPPAVAPAVEPDNDPEDTPLESPTTPAPVAGGTPATAFPAAPPAPPPPA